MDRFKLFIDGHQDPAVNMARDETLLRRLIAGESTPCLRFYQWGPPGLSLGRFQRIGEGVDLEQCREMGIHVVRRLTGGEAVLHDDEITYSIIIPLSHPTFEGIGVPNTYRTISKALVRGLELSGISATMAGDAPTRPDPAGQGVCFYTPTVNEVTAGGKKIIGSAQTREMKTILQHGSIPISTDLDKLFRATGIPPEQRLIFGELFQKRATNIIDQIGRRPDPDELIKNLVKGFEEFFMMQTELSQYSTQEENISKWMVENKYRSDRWTMKVS